MYLKLIIFTILSLLLLKSNYTVHCKPNRELYERYLINVLNHIEIQPGWSSMEHLYLKHKNNQITTVSDFKNEKTNTENYKIKLYMVTNFINCRYAELLGIFNNLLENFIAKCSNDLSKNMKDEFNFCVIKLSDTIKQSSDIFEKLSAIISFIDQLDLRIIDDDLDNLYTIVEDVNNYKRFFQWIKQMQPLVTEPTINDLSRNLIKDYNDIRRFYENNAKPKFKVLMNRIQSICVINENQFQSDFYMDYFIIYDYEGGQISSTKSHQFIIDISKKFQMFFDQTFKKDYIYMGFEKLISSNTSRNLIPPDNKWLKSDTKEYLKKLITYPGWSKLDYIQVKQRGLFLSIDNLKRPIENNSYTSVLGHIAMLIKCRYVEILYYFDFVLITLINSCYNEKNVNSSSQTFDANTKNVFTQCAFYVYSSMKISVKMLKCLLIALEKIRMSSRIPPQRTSMMPLEVIINQIKNFIDDFELNNYAAPDFSELIATQYLESLQKLLVENVNTKLNDIICKNVTFCQTLIVLLDKNYLKKKLYVSLELPSEETNVSYKKLCEYLIKFCNDVIWDDFRNLGFEQTIL
ncbi:uncharacterized protein LOC126898797 isoform X1 [Daktulosphaira vitifoliae]|uniref:uncharacterized protein LOC126898797 isoform X1 n=1 Tax=Daktulosphaira vitifoliae TaxID=58002 RepID=UPI0021AAD0F4|nr:uncharacterized protein LOC126898797 isoform X1 [Daktulosphaira vitifoliae]